MPLTPMMFQSQARERPTAQPDPSAAKAGRTWTQQGLSAKASAYVLATISVGFGLIAWELGQSDWHRAGALVLAALASAGQLIKAEGRSPRTSYNIAWFAYGFALVFLGWPAALFVIVSAYIVEWLWHRHRWYVQCFNIGASAIAVSAAGLVFGWAGGGAAGLNLQLTAAIVLALVVFTLISHLLVALAVWLTHGPTLTQFGVFNTLGLAIDFSLLGLGAGAAMLWRIHPTLALLNLLPLYLVYSTLRVPALERKSECDPKTGLYNSAYFNEALIRQLARNQRDARPFTVIMADLDHLRDINNSFGHLSGDSVLCGVAAVLTRVLPEAATTARFGGEEFAILLPDTQPEQAYPVIEAARKAVEDGAYVVSGSITPLKITISFGLAGPSQPGETASDLLDNADTALYAAKRAGRNQVRIYSATSYQALFDVEVR
jgi:diguanylate cyclase (GGDEF)-like protein